MGLTTASIKKRKLGGFVQCSGPVRGASWRLRGNPNTGKSSVSITSPASTQHTGNWPGKPRVVMPGGI